MSLQACVSFFPLHYALFCYFFAIFWFSFEVLYLYPSEFTYDRQPALIIPGFSGCLCCIYILFRLLVFKLNMMMMKKLFNNLFNLFIFHSLLNYNTRTTWNRLWYKYVSYISLLDIKSNQIRSYPGKSFTSVAGKSHQLSWKLDVCSNFNLIIA